MKEFHGFRIGFWERLGFRFRHEKLYEGREVKIGWASFGAYTFNLSISKNTIASVSNEETNHYERHAVYEDEAIAWFCRLSVNFSVATEKLDAAARVVNQGAGDASTQPSDHEGSS
jgi:hypothetical protein